MRTVATLAAAALTGCGLFAGPAPAWVVDRQPLPSCGEEVLGQGDAGDAEARSCLLEAFREGRGAELVSTRPTIEGDPVTRYVRVHPNGVVEIFVDATRDRFGSGEWERLRCERLVPIEEIRDDRPDLEFAAESVFVEIGCEVLPVP